MVLLHVLAQCQQNIAAANENEEVAIYYTYKENKNENFITVD